MERIMDNEIKDAKWLLRNLLCLCHFAFVSVKVADKTQKNDWWTGFIAVATRSQVSLSQPFTNFAWLIDNCRISTWFCFELVWRMKAWRCAKNCDRVPWQDHNLSNNISTRLPRACLVASLDALCGKFRYRITRILVVTTEAGITTEISIQWNPISHKIASPLCINLATNNQMLVEKCFHRKFLFLMRHFILPSPDFILALESFPQTP